MTTVRTIIDRYVDGTRLRLREVIEPDGTRTRKLGHKVRLGDGPAEVACTSLYLNDAEWAVLMRLPGRALTKRRHVVQRDGVTLAVDEHEDGTLVAEIDDGDTPPQAVPPWLDVLEDVSDDERWAGSSSCGPDARCVPQVRGKNCWIVSKGMACESPPS